jgi:hypothetical protein
MESGSNPLIHVNHNSSQADAINIPDEFREQSAVVSDCIMGLSYSYTYLFDGCHSWSIPSMSGILTCAHVYMLCCEAGAAKNSVSGQSEDTISWEQWQDARVFPCIHR